MALVRIVHEDPALEPAVVQERAVATYAARGWVIDAIVDSATPADAAPRELKKPQKNDSVARWRTYAVALGDLTVYEAFGKSRDDLAEHYTPSKTAPTPTDKPKES